MYRIRYGAAGRGAAAIGLLLLGAAGAGAGAAELRGVVVRVVDGDTIAVRIAGAVQHVRYIGVDSPELRHPRRGRELGAREAADVNRGLVGGRRVRLALDVRPRDRNGRLLAYVYADRVMVNAEMVRRGYAQVMTVPPNVRHQRLFLDLEREARSAGRGLWSRTAPRRRSARGRPRCHGRAGAPAPAERPAREVRVRWGYNHGSDRAPAPDGAAREAVAPPC